MSKLRTQPPLKGGRIPTGTRLSPTLRAEIDDLARRFKCSRSFVLGTMAAETLGHTEEEVYYEPKSTTKIIVRPRAVRTLVNIRRVK